MTYYGGMKMMIGLIMKYHRIILGVCCLLMTVSVSANAYAYTNICSSSIDAVPYGCSGEAETRLDLYPANYQETTIVFYRNGDLVDDKAEDDTNCYQTEVSMTVSYGQMYGSWLMRSYHWSDFGGTIDYDYRQVTDSF